MKEDILNILQLYLAAFPTAEMSICTLLETGLTENDLFTSMANSELFSSFKHHFYSSTSFLNWLNVTVLPPTFKVKGHPRTEDFQEVFLIFFTSSNGVYFVSIHTKRACINKCVNML